VKLYFPSDKTIPLDPGFSKGESTPGGRFPLFEKARPERGPSEGPGEILDNRGCQSPLAARRALLQGAQILHDAGIETSHLDAEVLLRHALKIERSQLYASLDSPLDRHQLQLFRQLITRRAGREPVAYITGHKEFWSLDFVVTRDVLIPRPETETVVDIALRKLGRAGKQDAWQALDLGTGSGVLAVCLAKECAGMQMTAIDIYTSVLAVAQLNSERQGVANRIQFLRGDLFEPLSRSNFHLIVANPPYVRRRELATLSPDVREWEPMVALDGGVDGLYF
jgi:release factor glutamine methyltransferase